MSKGLPLKPENLNRTMGTFALTLSGVTCIVGSGWLFSAYYTAQLAGAGAIWAWVIGCGAILLLALAIVELATAIPKSGGMARYGEYSHGSLAGFLAGWANWLAIVSVIPIEAVASVQYLGSWKGHWAQLLYLPHQGILSTDGLMVASVLLILFFLINYWTLELFVRSMVFMTIVKVAIPIATVFLLFMHGFHAQNFTAVHHAWIPYGWPSILTATVTTGIIFAFNGFQTPVNFAGEAKQAKSLVLAAVGSIVLCFILYLGLQIVFIGSLNTENLIAHGWHALNFESPFTELAIAANLNVLALTLYFNAFFSPSVTGMTYMASTTRMLFAMEQHGHMPKFIGRLHPKYRIPRGALWVNLIVSFAFLFVFRSWSHLVAVISVSTVISYIIAPVAAVSVRKYAPELQGATRVKGMLWIAPLSFVVISLLFFWARWPLTGKVIFAMLGGLLIYLFFEAKRGWPNFWQCFKSGVWFLVYMIAMALLSYMGGSEFGGHNWIKAGWDDLAVAVVALAFYYWGVKSAWRTPALEALCQEKASH